MQNRLATTSLPDLDTRSQVSDEGRMTQSDYADLLYEEIQKDKFFKSDEKALIESIIYSKIPNPP